MKPYEYNYMNLSNCVALVPTVLVLSPVQITARWPYHLATTSLTLLNSNAPFFPHPDCPLCTLGLNSSYI